MMLVSSRIAGIFCIKDAVLSLAKIEREKEGEGGEEGGRGP
jgi:hypothetical protein